MWKLYSEWCQIRRNLSAIHICIRQYRAKLLCVNKVEGVENRRHPPKSVSYGEGIVQGVAKVTQTRTLWFLVRVQVGPPNYSIKHKAFSAS